jgi:hypothetical protein
VASKVEDSKQMIEVKKSEVKIEVEIEVVVSKLEGAEHIIESKNREVEIGLGSSVEHESRCSVACASMPFAAKSPRKKKM